MKYFHLVWAALMRRKARTIFTMASVLTAFLLFGMLDSVRTAFSDVTHTIQGASALITLSRFGGIAGAGQLPLSLESQIAAVPGVRTISKVSSFGGFYQNPHNSIAGEAVGKDFFAQQDMVFPPGELKAFQTTRDGSVVGAALAKKFGWKVGDRIPLQATFWLKKNGSDIWTFNLVGIFRPRDPKQKAVQSIENMMFIRWEYFDEARAFDNGEVGWYQEKITDPASADRVARAIDVLNANSDHETKTESLNEFGASLLNQAVNIGLIIRAIMAAVFFTLILLTGNTMAQAVRERTPELAVLKTIGFDNYRMLGLVLAEAILLVLIGGVAGMLSAMAVVGGLKMTLGAALPMANIGGSSWGAAIALMIGIGLIVGTLPALRGMRLKIVDALAGR